MMLARLAFMIRAYNARVGPLETISIIPIRSFFIPVTQAGSWCGTIRRCPYYQDHKSGVPRLSKIAQGVSESAVKIAQFRPGDSEYILQAQLNLPRRLVPISISREDFPEIRRSKHMIRNVEIGMVQQIEDFAAKLQAMPLRVQRHIFVEGKIQVLEAGPGHY